MHGPDYLAILPLIITGGTSILVMIGIAIRRSHQLAALTTLAGFCAAFATLWAIDSVLPRQVTPLLIVDRYGVFYIGLMLAAAIFVTLMSYEYLERQAGFHEEYYVLLLLSALGAETIVISSHFASFFLGLELLSVSLYALTAYLRARPLPLEAGLKYLILAASSAAFLLFGMALIYSQTGSMEIGQIADFFAHGQAYSRPIVSAATALFITGIGFKLGVVPFHIWTPDIYEGAPAPVTAWVATASKGSIFALLVRYFYGSWWHHWSGTYLVFTIIAIASMFAGNILALLQSNVKRVLAYSSIAHLGYLLVAFQAATQALAVEAVTFYLVAYFITTLGAFGVITVLSPTGRDADSIDDYRGLFWRRPALALIFTAMLLSLAGIPLTAGFIGKFYILAAGTSSNIWTLVLVLIATSVVGLYYYLRIVVALFATPEAEVGGTAIVPAVSAISVESQSILWLLTALLIWFGVYPEQLLELIRSVASRIG
ncbi:MAG TPA: NADH-quinone oxidoreductase subunit N [Candidatus Acidoferrum sp.]|nr:NADH-quinone oxidoreductase subunit N [Candidatus Acidoferrum sp.]